MQKYVFTFGLGHLLGLHKYHLEITAPSFERARDRMMELCGTKWAFQYEAEEFYMNQEKMCTEGGEWMRTRCFDSIIVDY